MHSDPSSKPPPHASHPGMLGPVINTTCFPVDEAKQQMWTRIAPPTLASPRSIYCADFRMQVHLENLVLVGSLLAWSTQPKLLARLEF